MKTSNEIEQVSINSCLKDQRNFGSTTVHNVCNGQVSVVPWGAVDWGLMLGLFVLIFFLGKMLKTMAKDF